MTKLEVECLITLLATVEPRTIAEFGVQEGRTAKVLLSTIPSISQYIGIDVPPNFTTALAQQQREVPETAGWRVADDSRFRLIIRNSRDLRSENLPPLDAAFIDGDHSKTGVSHDTMLSYARIRPGGIIVWHDYGSVYLNDVTEVLDDLMLAGRDLKHVAGTWLAYEYC
jgi:predicted O-methyltransferase YrrM